VALRSVLIIGTGLIGTSIGMALTGQGRKVYLRDRMSSNALVASSLGAGMVETPTDVDLVIVAVPPAVTAHVVVRALSRYPQATVTDVASVKAPILEQVRLSGADLGRYVGSHPMAGSHRSGPLTANGDLFIDRTWVVAAHEDADDSCVALVEGLARLCGARVEVMDAREHDQAVAEVSHVPQIMSSLMAGNLVGVRASHLRLAGQGVRDVTRIAASDEDMWTQIITSNRDVIGTQLEKLAAALNDVRSHLDSPQVVFDFMKHGVEGVRGLPGKHGRTQMDYMHLIVEIPDSPGALARLFSDVDAAGVNVEDLEIEHDRTREVGYISIAVQPEKAEELAQAMTAAGWALKDEYCTDIVRKG